MLTLMKSTCFNFTSQSPCFLLPQPFDAAAGGDHPSKRAGHQEPGRDPLREGIHLAHHADESRRSHRSVGSKSGEGGDVSAEERRGEDSSI